MWASKSVQEWEHMGVLELAESRRQTGKSGIGSFSMRQTWLCGDRGDGHVCGLQVTLPLSCLLKPRGISC